MTPSASMPHLCRWAVMLALSCSINTSSTRQVDAWAPLLRNRQHTTTSPTSSTSSSSATRKHPSFFRKSLRLLPQSSSSSSSSTLVASPQTDTYKSDRIRRISHLAMSSQAYYDPAQRYPTAFSTSATTITTAITTSEDYALPKPSLSPLEVWCVGRIEQWYEIALSHKCPFLKRRATDFLDTLEMLVREVVVRPSNLVQLGPPVGLRGDERTRHKTKFLTLEQVADILRHDWKVDSRKGYYVTGRLTPSIYRNDCIFDGPDPDMPVQGLRKFLNAALHLFDPKQSECELLSLTVRENDIVARWKFNGVLRLPWRPKLPEVTGRTTYTFDDEGLIKEHAETWDISALEAFIKTEWFNFSKMQSH